MRYKSEATWKFVIVNGVLMRECTKCGHHDKHQPIFCPSCQAYMRKGQ